MRLIQWILVPGVLAVILAYFSLFRSRLADRILILLIGTVAAMLIMMPEWAQDLAKLMGVGRGADLVSYVGLTGLSFLSMIFFTGLRQAEQRITDLTREISLLHPKTPVPGDASQGGGKGEADETPA